MTRWLSSVVAIFITNPIKIQWKTHKAHRENINWVINK
jgi:hypothetical protein